jgi:predicted metal-dependent phosphoesterase TrpH
MTVVMGQRKRKVDLNALTGRADLHMRTLASDGIAPAWVMLDRVAQRGDLDVIAITDHDVLDASLRAYEQRERYPFDIIPGVEVTSADGHVLGLWVTQPIPKGMSLAETAAAIHEQNGVAILAHPFEPMIAPHTMWRYFRHPEVLIESEIDAVETINAGAFTPGNNWLAQRVFNNMDIPKVGSSDAHMPDSIATGSTRFRGHTAADLRKALAHGETAVEGSPWPLTVYLTLSVASIHRKRNASSAAKLPSIRPTPL